MNKESNVHKRETMSDKNDDDTGPGTGESTSQSATDTTTKDDTDHKVVKLPFNKTFVLLCTHFNAILYSLCFWIQLGVLPVRFRFCIPVLNFKC